MSINPIIFILVCMFFCGGGFLLCECCHVLFFDYSKRKKIEAGLKKHSYFMEKNNTAKDVSYNYFPLLYGVLSKYKLAYKHYESLCKCSVDPKLYANVTFQLDHIYGFLEALYSLNRLDRCLYLSCLSELNNFGNDFYIGYLRNKSDSAEYPF